MADKTKTPEKEESPVEVRARKISDIAVEIHDFLRHAEEQGFDEQTIADTLEGLAYDLDDKLAAYRMVMDGFEAEADLAEFHAKRLRAEAKDFSDRAKALKAKRQNMTYPLLNLFKKMGVSKRSGSYGTFFIKSGTKRLKTNDQVPPQFKKRKVMFETDEAALKEALDGLEEGESLEFAWYETGNETVQLRK